MEALIAQPKWSELFGWRENSFCPVVHEFLASLECSKTLRELDTPTIKFRIFNKAYSISVDKPGHKLGFYTTPEIDTSL